MVTTTFKNRQQKAILLINAGVSISEVAKACGYSSARTTERTYVKFLRRTMTKNKQSLKIK